MVFVNVVTIAEKKVVRISGVVNKSSAIDFEEQLSSVMDGGVKKILIDMSAVEYISAAGMQVLLDFYKNYRGDHAISIINPSSNISKLLFVVGLHNFMPVEHQVYTIGEFGS